MTSARLTADSGDLTDSVTPPAGDAGIGACLTCSDATVTDASAAALVTNQVTYVCGNPDGCHGAGAGGMGISPPNVFASMIDVASSEMPSLMRVLPYDPEQSYVYRKVRCEGGIEGGCMPPYARLSPELVQAFHDWIEAGAPTD